MQSGWGKGHEVDASVMKLWQQGDFGLKEHLVLGKQHELSFI